MENIKKQLLLIQQELEHGYEPLNELIYRLKHEGKSMGEIEQAILKMNRIQGAYDSAETALRMLQE